MGPVVPPMTEMTQRRESVPSETRSLSPSRRSLLIAALLTVAFLGALDHTIVSTSLATVAGELGALEYMSWVVVSYTLASTVLLPVLGALADRTGPRLIFLVALTTFVVASFACGFAHEMPQLIIARIGQGMSAAGLQLMSQTIVAEVTAPRQRPRYLSLIGAAFPVAILIGPLLGGMITDHWGWQWVFWVNVPVGMAALILAVFAIPHIEPAGGRSFDVPGAVLLTTVLSATVLSVAWFSTAEPAAWIAAGIGFVALVGFIAAERRHADPIIPVKLFGHRTFCAAVSLSAVVGAGLISATAYLPTYFQMSYGVSATVSGLVPIATVLGMLVSNLFTGWRVSRTGRYRIFPIIGTVMGALGLGAMALLPQYMPLWSAAAIMAVVGLGTGSFMSLTIAIVQSTVPRNKLGAATATAGLSGQIGSTIGSALVGGVIGAGVAARLPEGFDGGTLTPAVVHSADSALQATIATIYHDVFSPVFASLAMVYVVGFAAAVLVPNGRLANESPQAATTSAEPALRKGN